MAKTSVFRLLDIINVMYALCYVILWHEKCLAVEERQLNNWTVHLLETKRNELCFQLIKEAPVWLLLA